MAQLTDDCFAQGGRLMTTAEALDEIARRTDVVVGREHVPLNQATGRILAEDVVARVSVPPRDNAAVVGYAVSRWTGRPGAAKRCAFSPARKCRTAIRRPIR